MQGLLTKLDGVKKADVNWEKGEVVVEYDPNKVTASQMVQAVNGSGVFKVKAVEELSREKGSNAGGKKRDLRMAN